MNNITRLNLAKKTVSLALILSMFYQTYLAVKEIIFVFPQISFLGDYNAARSLYLQLLKKALIISLGLLVDFFYGLALLLKPVSATRLIHIIVGALIFIFSWIVFHTTAIDTIFKSLAGSAIIPL